MSTTAELTQELKQVKTDVDDHDKFINGNGKQGAKERLALLEKRDEDLICKIASVDNKINWLIGVVVSLFTIDRKSVV